MGSKGLGQGCGSTALVSGSWPGFTRFSAKRISFPVAQPSSAFSSLPVASEQESGQEMEIDALEACDKGILRAQGSSQKNCL